MQKALRIRTTVQPGGRVEVASPELEAGQTVVVVVRSTNYYITSTAWARRVMNKHAREAEMELYQLDYVLHEPREDQGWLYMAEIPDLPGCRAWAETANEALTELSTVAEQFILSYKDRGKPLPPRIARSLTGEGRISVAV